LSIIEKLSPLLRELEPVKDMNQKLPQTLSEIYFHLTGGGAIE
jgi:hypothetical protein